MIRYRFRALLGLFFVTKTLFYCRYSNRMWFSPLDSQPLLPGRAVRPDGPPQIGPETVGWTSARTEVRQTEALGLCCRCFEEYRCFSMALPTVFYLDSEGDLSVLFAVAHFKLCGVERTPCVVGKTSDFKSTSSESTAEHPNVRLLPEDLLRAAQAAICRCCITKHRCKV